MLRVNMEPCKNSTAAPCLSTNFYVNILDVVGSHKIFGVTGHQTR